MIKPESSGWLNNFLGAQTGNNKTDSTGKITSEILRHTYLKGIYSTRYQRVSLSFNSRPFSEKVRSRLFISDFLTSRRYST